jgi:hypothetical protein
MIPFTILYGGGCRVVVDGNRDIHHHHSASFVIIHIILLAIFVILGSQLEDLDQTKAQWWCP